MDWLSNEGPTPKTAKKEKDVWQVFKKALDLSKVKYSRIETSTEVGFPDLLIRYKGKIIFVELKKMDEKQQVKYRPRQLAFLQQLKDEGFSAFVGVLRGNDPVLLHPAEKYTAYALMHAHTLHDVLNML